MNGRENETGQNPEVEDQDAEPTQNAPGDEGPTGVTAPESDSEED